MATELTTLTLRAAMISLAFIASASAQSQQPYPHRPIRLIVPFGAGAGTDIGARIVSTKLAEAFDQQVVVDNRAGASGHPRAVSRVPACGM